MIGCSITTQAPQGGVGSQFDIHVKAEPPRVEHRRLDPDETFAMDVYAEPAVLHVQSDFPVKLRMLDADGKVLLNRNLDGQRQRGMPFVYVLDVINEEHAEMMSKVKKVEARPLDHKRTTLSYMIASKT